MDSLRDVCCCFSQASASAAANCCTIVCRTTGGSDPGCARSLQKSAGDLGCRKKEWLVFYLPELGIRDSAKQPFRQVLAFVPFHTLSFGLLQDSRNILKVGQIPAGLVSSG